jgi:hypothetical protein
MGNIYRESAGGGTENVPLFKLHTDTVIVHNGRNLHMHTVIKTRGFIVSGVLLQYVCFSAVHLLKDECIHL